MKGRLVNTKKEPIARARIELSVHSPHFGAVAVNGETDEAGNFVFSGPPPGHYQLYFMPPNENRGEWIKLRDVDVVDQPLDLGEVVNDVGSVIINMTSDDPADVKSIQYLSVTTDEPNRMWQESVSRAAPLVGRSDRWRANDVPAGTFRVQAHLKDDKPNVIARFERKPDEAETAVKLHIPAATATLTVTRAAGVSTPSDNPRVTRSWPCRTRTSPCKHPSSCRRQTRRR